MEKKNTHTFKWYVNVENGTDRTFFCNIFLVVAATPTAQTEARIRKIKSPAKPEPLKFSSFFRTAVVLLSFYAIVYRLV